MFYRRMPHRVFILLLGIVGVGANACASTPQVLPTLAPTLPVATSVVNTIRPTLPPTWTPIPTQLQIQAETVPSFEDSQMEVTETGLQATSVQVSENLIAYVNTIQYSGERTPSTDIFLFDLDTGVIVNLTNDIHDDKNPYWSADGTEIVYNSRGRYPATQVDQLYTISVKGGERRKVDLNSRVHVTDPAWSPDKQYLLYETRAVNEGDRDIFLFDMNSSIREVKRITDDNIEQFGVAWSPDGQRFAMTVEGRGDGTEIHIVNADGSNPISLTPMRAADRYPAWSPDGSHIAFTSDRQQSGNYDIYVMNADGSDVRRLTKSHSRDENPTWSPDGREIVYSADKQLAMVSADGTRVSFYKREGITPAWRAKPGTQIFPMPALVETPTVISNIASNITPLPLNTGRNNIAFEAFSEDLPITPENGRDIYVLNLSTGEAVNFTNRPGHEQNPSWSPDGNWLAFDSYGHDQKSGRSDIFIMSADGSVVRQLTTEGGSVPAWSPDGERIAFVSAMDGQSNEIYIMNADGSNVVAITDNPYDDSKPSWSPDGRQIAFQSTADRRYFNIFVVNADGTNLRQITEQPGNYNFPAWSPDGQKIALISFTQNRNNLSVMNVDGSNMVRLNQDTEAQDAYPTWSPDGRQIVFVTKSVQLTIINADGTNMRVLTEFGGRAPSWQP